MHTSKGKHKRVEAVSESEGLGPKQRGKLFRGRVVARADHSDISLPTLARVARKISNQITKSGHKLVGDDEEE